MAIPSGEELKILFERVRDLSNQAKLLGDKAQQAVAACAQGLAKAEQDAGVSGAATIDSVRLSALEDQLRESLQTTLEGLARALETALQEDGPRDPRSLMSNAYAPNSWIIALVLLGALGSVAAILWVCALWPAATEGLGRTGTTAMAPTKPAPGTAEAPVTQSGTASAVRPASATTSGAESGASSGTAGVSSLAQKLEDTSCRTGHCPPELTVLQAVIALGALGGFLHLTSSLAQFIGNRQLRRSWIPYYLLMPFEGGALAPIVYLLLRVGVLSPGAGVAELNTVGLYAFAALTGLFSKQALSMLGDVFNIIFKKIQAKDSLPADRRGPSSGSGSQP
jgi:hypothetical protein